METLKQRPCLEYRLQNALSEEERISILTALLKSENRSVAEISEFTAIYSVMGLLQKRYDEEEIRKILGCVSPLTCTEALSNAPREMCHACEYSVTYTNRFLQEEKKLLSGCFKFSNLKNKLKQSFRTKGCELLFSSFIRVNEKGVPLYMEINRLIFFSSSFEPLKWDTGNDELSILEKTERAFIPVLEEAKKEYGDLFTKDCEDFLKRYLKNIIRQSLSLKDSFDDLKSLALTINNKIKGKEEPKKEEKKEQKKAEAPIDLSTKAFIDFINEKDRSPEKEVPKEPEIPKSFSALEQKKTPEKIEEEQTPLPSAPKSPLISFTKTGFETEADETDVYTLTEDAVPYVNYCILSNSIIPLEVVENNGQVTVLLHFPRQRKSFLVSPKDNYGAMILTSVMRDSHITKITCFSFELFSLLQRAGIKVRNVIDLIFLLEDALGITFSHVRSRNNYMKVLSHLNSNSKENCYVKDAVKTYKGAFRRLFASIGESGKVLLTNQSELFGFLSGTNALRGASVSLIEGAKGPYEMSFDTELFSPSQDETEITFKVNNKAEEETLILIYRDVLFSLSKTSMPVYVLDFGFNGVTLLTRRSFRADIFTLLNRLLVRVAAFYLNEIPDITVSFIEGDKRDKTVKVGC